MIIISSAMSGVYLIKISRDRVRVCDELLIFCDMLKSDISSRRTPLDVLIKSIGDNASLSHLGFINDDFFNKREDVSSVLRQQDNRRISDFLLSLGGYDAPEQINEIDFFISFISSRRSEYENVCKTKSRLYFTLCFSVGCVVSLMLI